jgi:hypothetical protein
VAETKRMTAEQVVSFLLEEEGDDVLRESLRWVVQQLMEAEVSELIGAEHGERSEARLTHRNGYRPRSWATRAGEIELAIPSSVAAPISRASSSDVSAHSRRGQGRTSPPSMSRQGRRSGPLSRLPPPYEAASRH